MSEIRVDTITDSSGQPNYLPLSGGTLTGELTATNVVRTNGNAISGVAYAKGISSGSGNGVRLLNCTCSKISRGQIRVTFNPTITTSNYTPIAMPIDNQYSHSWIIDRDNTGFTIVTRNYEDLYQGVTGTPSTVDRNVSWVVFT